MKSKLLNFVLIFGLILSLFTGCNGDASEQLLNGAGTEPLSYLCFTAEEAGSKVKLSVTGTLTTPVIEYSTDGSTWTSYNIGTDVTLTNIDDKVYLRGNNDSFSKSDSDNYIKFVMKGKIAGSGNIMSLLDKTCQLKNLSGKDYVFVRLFEGCTALTTAPELPATTLASHCYEYMFSGCTALTTAPELPATTLENCNNCYNTMFLNCSSLTEAPDLPATTLAEYCYSNMFRVCTGLTTVPNSLPAETLEDHCYTNMFYGCTSLTTAPELPAQNLAEYCYMNMFNGCTELTAVPSSLPAETLKNECYDGMFSGCSKLETAPELPAQNLAKKCYRNMFSGCNALNKIKVGFITTNWTSLPEDATENWLYGVALSGTFTCPAGLAEERGSSYIPENWTIIPIV